MGRGTPIAEQMDIERIEELRVAGMSTKQIAQAQNVSYTYLRKVCSQCELNSAHKVRRAVVRRFMLTSSPEEIAEFLRLYHKQQVSVSCVRDLIKRMMAQRYGVQLGLFTRKPIAA